MSRRSMRSVMLALVVVVLGTVGSAAQSKDADIVAFFKNYDAAFSAMSLDKLAPLHHPDVTRFEGSFVNTGWLDYRDTHLGAEFKSYKSMEFAHTNVVVHMLGDSAAYVTADYALKYTTAERTTEGGGIATFVLVKDQGNWKIRHHHTASRRRPAGGL
jgi:ketosteroid isomerase-like protein